MRIAFASVVAVTAALSAQAETGLDVTVHDAPATLSAEDRATAAADLAVIEAHAKGRAERAELLDAIRREIRGTKADWFDKQRVLTRYMGGYADRSLRDGEAFAYREYYQKQVAQARGQFFGELLRADLNADWKLSRQELLAVLGDDSGTQVARLFILGDANSNYVLDLPEMQSVVDEVYRQRSYGLRQDQDALVLFDLDDDGILTPEEVRRSLLALSQ